MQDTIINYSLRLKRRHKHIKIKAKIKTKTKNRSPIAWKRQHKAKAYPEKVKVTKIM